MKRYLVMFTTDYFSGGENPILSTDDAELAIATACKRAKSCCDAATVYDLQEQKVAVFFDDVKKLNWQPVEEWEIA